MDIKQLKYLIALEQTHNFGQRFEGFTAVDRVAARTSSSRTLQLHNTGL